MARTRLGFLLGVRVGRGDQIVRRPLHERVAQLPGIERGCSRRWPPSAERSWGLLADRVYRYDADEGVDLVRSCVDSVGAWMQDGAVELQVLLAPAYGRSRAHVIRTRSGRAPGGGSLGARDVRSDHPVVVLRPACPPATRLSDMVTWFLRARAEAGPVNGTASPPEA